MSFYKYTRLALLLIFPATIGGAATIAPFGPPVESDIVSAFIPPTRSDDPYIATEQSVLRWDADTESWKTIYSLPWSNARILAVSGYEKSSKPVYVVHSAGIARSSDAGESWIESVPTGFAAAADGMIEILVNPAERQHAVLLTGPAAWETTDYGATWTKLYSAGTDDPIVGGGFLVQPSDDASALLLATRASLFRFQGIPLARFSEWSAPYPLSRLIAHPRDPVAFVQMAADRWTILAAPFAGELLSTEPVKLAGSGFAPNRAGSSSLWIAENNRVEIASLIADPVQSLPVVTDLPAPARTLLPHPDDQDSVYLYQGPQLHLIDDAFKGVPPEFILPAPRPDSAEGLRWPSETLATGETPGAAAVSGSKEQTETALEAIIAKQPPFYLVAGKAVRFAFGRPVDFAKWQRQARRRYWLPELRVQGGVRERNTDNHRIIESVDQFGNPREPEDLNLPDDIRSLGYAAIVLEWDLYNLLFDDDQVDVHRERRYTQKQRRELVEDLSKLYHARIQKIAEKEGLFGEPSPQQHARLVLQINELTEIINGFCGENIFQ